MNSGGPSWGSPGGPSVIEGGQNDAWQSQGAPSAVLGRFKPYRRAQGTAVGASTTQWYPSYRLTTTRPSLPCNLARARAFGDARRRNDFELPRACGQGRQSFQRRCLAGQGGRGGGAAAAVDLSAGAGPPSCPVVGPRLSGTSTDRATRSWPGASAEWQTGGAWPMLYCGRGGAS